MSLKTRTLGALGALVLAATASTNALAAPPAAAAGPASPQSGAGGARASIQLDLGHATTAFVGQALPITVRAYFRGVEAVTLEGAPQLASREIVTSQLAGEPRQATAIIGGESTVVATWTGTVTPSSVGPIDLSIDLPVRLRYREAAPRVALRDPWQDDPFAGLGADPFDASIFDRMRHMMDQQMQQQPMGRVREQATELRATAHLDALALPATDQPASFTGAVGRFDLTASASSTHLGASEPLTLRVAVAGDGDLDRVDLPGVATSDTWKAYPSKVMTSAPSPGKRRGARVFEQVLVPLRSGDLTVPSISLTAFDPVSGRYVTRETRPLYVSVDAGSAPEAAGPSPANAASTAPPSLAEAMPIAMSPIQPWRVGLRVAPVLLVAAAAALLGVLRHFRTERALRRAMRRAASENAVDGFFTSARALIEARLARLWDVPPEAVTAPSIRERLGAKGDALAEVIAADQSLRFGRAAFERAELLSLCSLVEHSLRGAS